jgi:hypothetical protein
MHCIVVKGQRDGASWEGMRSVELLAYVPSLKKVIILFILLLKRLKTNLLVEDWLKIMHPGGVSFRMLDLPDFAAGLPKHPLEPTDSKVSLLHETYRNILSFKRGEGVFKLVGDLTPGDSRFQVPSEEEVVIWPYQEQRFLAEGITGYRGLKGIHEQKAFQPFTTWEIGPFTEMGKLILIAFVIEFSGETYDYLLPKNRKDFTVDGPSPLRKNIEHGYIPLLESPDDRHRWASKLQEFEDYIDFGPRHDIVFLHNEAEGAAKVEFDSIGSRLSLKGQLQPKRAALACRYRSLGSPFRLKMHYASDPALPPPAPEKKHMTVPS